MNVCKWCMSGSATQNSILLSVLPKLNKIFNQSINQTICVIIKMSDSIISSFVRNNLPYATMRHSVIRFWEPPLGHHETFSDKSLGTSPRPP